MTFSNKPQLIVNYGSLVYSDASLRLISIVGGLWPADFPLLASGAQDPWVWFGPQRSGCSVARVPPPPYPEDVTPSERKRKRKKMLA